VTQTLEPPTVFIVDDDAAVRRSLVALLELFELPVECYASASEFLAAYRPHRRGCLVLDVRLTGGSGIDLHSRLVREGGKLPTIFVTGHALPLITDEARRLGVVAVFQKPCRPQLLVDAIRKALGSQA
jgi:two-component system response regulator FixJ